MEARVSRGTLGSSRGAEAPPLHRIRLGCHPSAVAPISIERHLVQNRLGDLWWSIMVRMALVREEGDVVALRRGGEKAYIAVLLGIMVLVSLIVAAGSGPLGAHVFGSVMFVLIGVLWIRWIRTEVRAEQDILVLRTPFRTHEIPWSDVARAEIVPTNLNRLFAVVRVTLKSGKRIKVDGVARRWSKTDNDSSDVGQMVAEINRRISN